MVDAGNSSQDPAVLAQRLFEGFEDHRADAATPARVELAAGGRSADRDELLAVVHNLEAVTASLVATSEALAAIARSLTD